MMNNFIGPDKIIEKKKDFLFPCAQHFYKDPPQIVKGSMQYLYDSTGKKYLDFFAGVSVMNCGHCNPVILDATIKQMQTLQHTTTIYLTQPIVDLAEKFAEALPGNLKRSFFCCTGSEANEGALLHAKLYTKKSGFIAFKGGLHGRTHLTISGTGIEMWQIDPYPYKDFHFISNIDSKLDYNNTITVNQVEDAAKSTIVELEEFVDSPAGDSIAALIMEPIQGNGGIITPPLWYFKEVQRVLKKKNILLIIDEVQTGFGRTGKMFAIENYGIVPDFITTAKALGNGTPISAFSTTDEIASVFTKPSASTLGGNPVASTTALAVLDYIKDNDLVNRSKVLGEMLFKGLNELKDKYDFIKDHRGIGLMQGLHLGAINNLSSAEATDLILEKLMKKGILVGKNGINRNVLAFQPPLVIIEDDIEFIVKTLDEVFSSLDS